MQWRIEHEVWGSVVYSYVKYYIHPDSYHIFELKEGDGVKSLISDNIYILQNPLLFNEGDKPITIQRNNTAFFMPIKEKDNG